MTITDKILEIVSSSILASGYFGVFILMTLESVILPLPSEAILPFAGYLVSIGELNLWLVVIAATCGSLVGSTLGYFLGIYGGRPFLRKYGKYFLLHEKQLAMGDRWFTRYGAKAVFFSRLLPVVRHFISIPAGISRMHWGKFVAYTALGAFAWNLSLTYLGFFLGEQWKNISKYTAPFESLLVLLVIIVIIWYIIEAVKKRALTLR